jgi:hypothetical protein
MGQEASRYQGREMLDALEMFQAPPPCPCVLATGDEKALCAEFPFGHLTSLLSVQTDSPHLDLGNGLRMVLQLPEGPSGLDNPEAARKALELNEWEQKVRLGSHFLGSWCPAPALCFLSFLPNGLFARHLVVAYAIEAMHRAHWAATDVFQAGWDLEEAMKLKSVMSPEELAAVAYAGRAAVFDIPDDMMDKPVTAGMSADQIEALTRAVEKMANLADTEQKQRKKTDERKRRRQK